MHSSRSGKRDFLSILIGTVNRLQYSLGCSIRIVAAAFARLEGDTFNWTYRREVGYIWFLNAFNVTNRYHMAADSLSLLEGKASVLAIRFSGQLMCMSKL